LPRRSVFGGFSSGQVCCALAAIINFRRQKCHVEFSFPPGPTQINKEYFTEHAPFGFQPFYYLQGPRNYLVKRL
jgi:hypothetical protein